MECFRVSCHSVNLKGRHLCSFIFVWFCTFQIPVSARSGRAGAWKSGVPVGSQPTLEARAGGGSGRRPGLTTRVHEATRHNPHPAGRPQTSAPDCPSPALASAELGPWPSGAPRAMWSLHVGLDGRPVAHCSPRNI